MRPSFIIVYIEKEGSLS